MNSMRIPCTPTSQSRKSFPSSKWVRIETETLNLGNSSLVIGLKRESLKALVMAYSLSPDCRFMALKVPMQPRSRLSFPITHVTNKGLKGKRMSKLKSKTAGSDVYEIISVIIKTVVLFYMVKNIFMMETARA